MKQRNSNFDINNALCDYVYNHRWLAGCQLLIISTLMIIYPGSAGSQQAPDLTRPKIVVPEKIAGVNTVTAEQVIESLTSDNPPVLIDARINQDREHGYIESSIGLPDIETNCDTLNKVSANKNRHLMFYCNGIQCGRSVVSIKVARSCGYHNLSWFKGGFAEWNKKGYQYIKSR